MDFFHGTQVNDVISKLVTISQANAGTIALIGTAPGVDPGMQLVNSPVDAAKYGAVVFDGRTIPHALEIIFAQNASRVVVINCAKPSHLTLVEAEAVVVGSAYTAPLANIPVGALSVSGMVGEEKTPLVLGVDYSYSDGDQFITILTRRTFAIAARLTVTYNYFDASTVVPNDIIGGIAEDGTRSGVALLALAYATYKLTPKIVIAPTYIEIETVCDAIDTQLVKLRARSIVDAPDSLTLATAITSRGATGPYANFFSNSLRRFGVFPYVYKPDPLNPTGDGQPFPASAYFAGAWAASITANGVQRSPSNLLIAGISKIRQPLSCDIGDASSDVSVLNAAAIGTIHTGLGVRTWGNRNLAFDKDQNSGINTFLAVQLVQDVIDESVLNASLQFQDNDLDKALIDTIVSAVNGFLNTLILAKTIIDGSCVYDPTLNTPTLLANGQITFTMSFLPPTPAENITFQSFVDISLFNGIS